MKGRKSCMTENHHILHFLPVRGLETIFLVGGLGVEEQQNSRREVPILLHVISFWEFRPKGKLSDQNHEHFTKCNNKFETLSPLLLLTA